MAGEAENSSAIDEHDSKDCNQKMKPLNLIHDNLPNCTNQEENVEEDDYAEEEAKPVGDVIRVSNKGRHLQKHFQAFHFHGSRFHLEDPVLLTPEDDNCDEAKPSIIVIKDIFQTIDGELTVCGQRFYRPEQAVNKEGGNWTRNDPREIFYSSRLDDYPANSVMHKVVIHLVPLLKPMPDRKDHPGFFVRKVYDYGGRRIRDLGDKDCKGSFILKGSPFG